MELLVFTFLSYFAAGIVFITREADLHMIEANSTIHHLHHPVLRLAGGVIMMVLWPAFLLTEMLPKQPSPMAIKIDNY